MMSMLPILPAITTVERDIGLKIRSLQPYPSTSTGRRHRVRLSFMHLGVGHPSKGFPRKSAPIALLDTFGF